MPSKRLVRRVVLERASRVLLVRLLRTFGASFFEAHGVSLAELEAAPARDRRLVHRVFDLLHDAKADPELPAALRSRLAAWDALATPAGGEAVLHADVAGAIPRATYGDEDLALVMLLDHPELAVEARREAEADLVQSFTEYEPEAPRAFAVGDAEARALERALGERLEAKGRTRLCQVHRRREGSHLSMEVVFAKRPRTFDKVDAAALELDQSTDIHTERAFAEIDLDRGALGIHAPAVMKDMLREALGTVLAGAAAFFHAARSYDLSPFARPEEALSIEGVAGLSRVELHAIHVQTPRAGTTMSFVRPRRDVRDDDDARAVMRLALERGAVVAVKLYLFVAGRARPTCVELSTKNAKSVLDFDRGDPEVVSVVRAYLAARGVLREGAAAIASVPHTAVTESTASPLVES
jgi:hypothetical protein